ncbi:MAG: chloramphenicol phosphotransferase CPT family protein [Fibrobacterota bacterium]|nr:chloramphenicol phosphotransferase CPT family protein [Fibrobacterota bacterium]
MKKSQIIFLNGASSSGKTTLGRALQKILPQPFLYLSSDLLIDANILPEINSMEQRVEWKWENIRPIFFDGFHRSIPAMALAGNDLIVEHVLEFKTWYDDCRQLLEPFDVFYVGVFCPIPELELREKKRGDRRIGEGRSHLEDGVHTWGPYDFIIDTSLSNPEVSAQHVLNAFKSKREIGVFHIGYN